MRALIGGIEEQQSVEVSVSDMTQHRPAEWLPGEDLLRAGHRLRQTRQGHGGVGGQRTSAGPGGDTRRVRVVPCLPELTAFALIGCPGEVRGTELGNDLVCFLRLLVHA